MMFPPTCPPRHRCSGHTLPELLVVMAVFLFVIGGVIVANFFGLRTVELTQPRLSAGDEARRVLGSLMDEITAARTLEVGSGDLGSFTAPADGALREGNAIQIYPTFATNVFVRYFLDPGDRTLKRSTNDALAAATLIGGVTNTIVFSEQRPDGEVLTNGQASFALGLLLQFDLIAGTGTPVGTGEHFATYELRSTVARRNR